MSAGWWSKCCSNSWLVVHLIRMRRVMVLLPDDLGQPPARAGGCALGVYRQKECIEHARHSPGIQVGAGHDKVKQPGADRGGSNVGLLEISIGHNYAAHDRLQIPGAFWKVHRAHVRSISPAGSPWSRNSSARISSSLMLTACMATTIASSLACRRACRQRSHSARPSHLPTPQVRVVPAVEGGG